MFRDGIYKYLYILHSMNYSAIEEQNTLVNLWCEISSVDSVVYRPAISTNWAVRMHASA